MELKNIAKLAALAPSAHNSQPWLFIIDEQKNCITVKPNLKRILGYSDPDHRQFYLSLGAAVANLQLGGQGYGLETSIEYNDKGEEGIWTTVTFRNGSGIVQQKIIDAVINRHNNRNLFTSTPLPENFKNNIKQILLNGATLHIIEDPEIKLKIKNVVAAATNEAFHDKKFTSELASWMHPSLKKYRDGFVGYNLGIPWPMSFLFPTMLKHLPLAKPQTKMQTDMLEHAPAYGVLTAAQDNPKQWLLTGQIFEKIAVEAEQNHIKIGAFGAPVETGQHYKNLQNILGTNERPQMFFRLGYTNKIPPKSPRLPLEQIIQSV